MAGEFVGPVQERILCTQRISYGPPEGGRGTLMVDFPIDGQGGRVANFVVLDSPQAKQLGRWGLCEREVLRARKYALRWKELLPPPPADGRPHHADGAEAWSAAMVYFDSAVLAYARCFSDGDNGHLKLERTHVPDAYRPMHDMVMALRNNLVAHNNAAFEFHTVAVMLDAQRPQAFGVMKVLIEPQMGVIGGGQGEQFVALINSLLEVVRVKLRRAETQVSTQIHQRPLADWRAMAWQSLRIVMPFAPDDVQVLDLPEVRAQNLAGDAKPTID